MPTDERCFAVRHRLANADSAAATPQTWHVLWLVALLTWLH